NGDAPGLHARLYVIALIDVPQPRVGAGTGFPQGAAGRLFFVRRTPVKQRLRPDCRALFATRIVRTNACRPGRVKTPAFASNRAVPPRVRARRSGSPPTR